MARREIKLQPGEELVVRIGSGRSLERVLDEIVAEGHISVELGRNELIDKWRCVSDRADPDGPDIHQDFAPWAWHNHHGDTYAKTPLAAAKDRLQQIQAGLGLAVLFGFFLRKGASHG